MKICGGKYSEATKATTPKVPPTLGNRPALQIHLLTENAFGSHPADRLGTA